MFSKSSGISLLLLCGCALVSCGKQQSVTLTAGAVAEASPGGRVTTRTPTSQEIADLQRNIAQREAIDAHYPGSSAPLGVHSERVIGVSVPGILKLQGGRTVRLDGITCNETAVAYLRRVLQDKNVTVVVLPSDNRRTNPAPAEVWSVDKSLQLQHVTSGPSYSNINETAIASDWCEAHATATNKHNARYAALASAFQHQPSAR